MPEIFISYSREDQEHVFPVVNKLREQGLDIWIDQEGIHGAKLWSQEIVNAIENSKVFILFASTKAFVSKNVTKELALASESDKHILPVFIEDAEIPAAMKYQLAGIQHLIHKKGDDNQTIDNILRTVSSLKIDSVVKNLNTSSNTNSSLQTSDSSRIPFAIAAITAIILAVVLTFFFSQGLKNDANKSPSIVKAYKSTTDLCIVTVHDSEVAENVFEGNRELRDGLDEKLSRFKDYKVEKGKAVSPDATTQEILSVAKKLNAEYVLQVSTNNEKERINAKLLNVNEGRNFWSKTLRQNDIVGNGDFIDEATGLIAAHIAGHDGAIHRDILAKALVKNEEDLTPIELLQLGKNVWEEQTEDVTVKGTKYLERCIELNPDISTAYAILSEVYLEDVRADYNLIPNAIKKAKEAVSRSIELSPSNAIALIEQIWISWYEKDFTACKLQAEAAIKANPYEPLVLVSAGSFYLTTGLDLDLGKKLNDLALAYNETPQGWYYVGYVNYYIENNNYEKALEYALKSGTDNNDAHMARSMALYWVNNQKDTAIKYYKELVTKYPEYTMDTLRRNHEVWNYSKASQKLIQNAFSEVKNAANN